MIVKCTVDALIIRSLPVAEDATDLNKRMIKAQKAEVYGTSLDGSWLYVDAPAARGWCSRSFLEEIEDDTPSPAWPKVPTGLEEIKRIFGDPGKPICAAGRAHLPIPLKLAWNDQSVLVLTCHKLMEDVFTSVFNQLHQAGLWDELQNTGGIYNARSVTNSQKISTHSWGISIDVDTIDNALGAKPKMSPRIIKIFEDHGFTWGGNFHRPDGMHFQYAKGY